MAGPRPETTPAAPILELRGLTRHGEYHDITLTIAPGEVVGLLMLAMLIPILSGGFNLAATFSANIAGLRLAWVLIWGGGAAARPVVLVLGVPVPLIVFGLCAVLWAVILNRTRLGFSIYQLGSNLEATRYSGVNTRRALTMVYVLSGLMCAVAGIIMAARFNSVRVGMARPSRSFRRLWTGPAGGAAHQQPRRRAGFPEEGAGRHRRHRRRGDERRSVWRHRPAHRQAPDRGRI
ncbi:MAG: ABC transporter permease subunit [Paracoccus sp. (in: a-proteobacteria)]|uniref:ABC transporter permease n=1 Tax=Paracoccus sp. TaxID=267 RepID=UPI00391DD7E6